MTDSSTKLRGNSQRVLITGGSGLVGTRLSELLTDQGYEVAHLSRNPTKGTYESFHWDIKKKEVDKDAIKGTDVIIHLAGAGVADKRWTKEWKKEIYDSRIDSTQLLFDAVKNHNSRLRQFISASAIGYYGWDTGDKMVDENHEQGNGFLAEVVHDWENAVKKFDEIGVSNSLVRVGVVLSRKGGALKEIAKPIKMGFGAALGSGKQYMSWIHIDDLCGIFMHLLANGETDVFNGVAPDPVSNKAFTKKLAKAMKKPLFLPNVPSFVLKLMVGEMQVMLTGGNNVSSKKIEDVGFNFQYPSLDSALKELIG